MQEKHLPQLEILLLLKHAFVFTLQHIIFTKQKKQEICPENLLKYIKSVSA